MDKFFNWFGKRETASASTTSSTTGSTGSYEERKIRPNSAGASLTISAVYRAVELRAKTIAQMQMQYHKRNKAGGNFVTDMRGSGKMMNYLLQVEPNPLMSATAFFEGIVIRRLLLGNAYVYITRNNVYEPAAFWLCTSGSYNEASGTYNLTYMSEFGLKNVEASRRDVLHFANTFRDDNGIMGIPTITYAIDSLSLIKTEGNQALDSAAKGGRMKLLVGEDKSSNRGLISGGLYDKDAIDDYAEELSNKVYVQDVIGIRGLDKAINITMTAQEMQMIELLGIGMDDVARFFGVPRPLLMLDTNSHYTTPTNATMEFMSRTIAPDAREIEDEFNRKLLSVDDFDNRRFHMCEQPLLRMDKETQAKVDEINLRTGAKSPNEIRQQYDMPTVEGGDSLFLSTNLAEMNSAKLRGEATHQEGEKGGEA